MVWIKFKCNDLPYVFLVEENVAQQFEEYLVQVNEAIENSSTITLSEVGYNSMSRILEYYDRHKNVERPSSEEELRKFDDEFYHNLNQRNLARVVLLDAVHLGAKNLSNFLFSKVDPTTLPANDYFQRLLRVSNPAARSDSDIPSVSNSNPTPHSDSETPSVSNQNPTPRNDSKIPSDNNPNPSPHSDS